MRIPFFVIFETFCGVKGSQTPPEVIKLVKIHIFLSKLYHFILGTLSVILGRVSPGQLDFVGTEL